MRTFVFENKYDKQTYFYIDEQSMEIRETGISGQISSYIFQYSEIDNYAVIPTVQGLYELSFYGKEKCIKQVVDGKEKNISMAMVYVAMPKAMREMMKNSPARAAVPENLDESDVRLVIREYTPLRSGLDKAQDNRKKVCERIQNASQNERGTVYIERLTTWSEYELQINQVPYFTLYPKQQREKLSKEELLELEKKEFYLKPQWIDKSTWAFELPYGTWEIACSYEYEIERPGKHTEIIAKGKVQLDAAHPVCYLNKRKGLFAHIFKGKNEK